MPIFQDKFPPRNFLNSLKTSGVVQKPTGHFLTHSVSLRCFVPACNSAYRHRICHYQLQLSKAFTAMASPVRGSVMYQRYA